MIKPSIIKKQRIIICLLLLLIIITIIVGIRLGYSSISYERVIATILGEGTSKEEFILYSVRFPRIIIILLAGMALSLSGAILQGITGNDLADPGIIGINSGAGVAITIFFLFFPVTSSVFAYSLPLIAFIGAFLTAVIIYLFSFKKGIALQPKRLVIIGIGFSMALSGVMVVLISSAEREKVDFIAKWLNGNIWGSDWSFVWALIPWLLLLIPFTLYKANILNILALNESVSVGVGLSVEKERRVLLLVAVALASSAISVTGSISFIGLMGPHIAKALIGPRNQLFLPIAILIGGWLLLFADTIGRNIVNPDGIAVGIMVALIGAPYFIYLLLKDK